MFDRLSEDQRQVLNVVREGHNVFITAGRGGTARKNNCLLSSIFQAGEGGFGQMMYRSSERSPQDLYSTCTVPCPGLIFFAASWSGPATSANVVSVVLDYILRVCQSLWDSFLYLGKLHWFLYLLLSYFYDPGMFIFRWSSNFVEKVVLNESMSAKMASRVSYLVYYYCI